MARYTGPKSRIARKFKEPIFGPDKHLEKKNYPPGMHGNARRRGKKSEYAMQLMEKQKAKYTYGLLEKQFSNTYKKATILKGIKGENLLKLLEARLDNTVYRMGFARTRSAARQFVSHRHVTVNGKVVNIPSYSLRAGDEVAIRERSKSLEAITDAVANSRSTFSWLEVDQKELSGKYLSMPERSEIPENIKEQLIVELYSK